MPTITMPNTFADGSTAAANNLNENVYSPRSTPVSLDVINGQLDGNNIGNMTVRRWMLQSGAAARVGSVGRTVNLDYFGDQFGGFVNANAIVGANEASNLDAFLAIPGCSRTFELTYSPSWLLFSWSVFAVNDGLYTADQRTVFRLFWDGAAVAGQRRVVPAHVRSFAGPIAVRSSAMFQRVWSGHLLLATPARGWHDVSLRVASDCPQSRTRSGNMVVVALR